MNLSFSFKTLSFLQNNLIWKFQAPPEGPSSESTVTEKRTPPDQSGRDLAELLEQVAEEAELREDVEGLTKKEILKIRNDLIRQAKREGWITEEEIQHVKSLKPQEGMNWMNKRTALEATIEKDYPLKQYKNLITYLRKKEPQDAIDWLGEEGKINSSIPHDWPKSWMLIKPLETEGNFAERHVEIERLIERKKKVYEYFSFQLINRGSGPASADQKLLNIIMQSDIQEAEKFMEQNKQLSFSPWFDAEGALDKQLRSDNRSNSKPGHSIVDYETMTFNDYSGMIFIKPVWKNHDKPEVTIEDLLSERTD